MDIITLYLLFRSTTLFRSTSVLSTLHPYDFVIDTSYQHIYLYMDIYVFYFEGNFWIYIYSA